MDDVRREIMEFSMWAGVLLHGNSMNTPLTEGEARLLETYITRLAEKYLSRSANTGPQPKHVKAEESYKRAV